MKNDLTFSLSLIERGDYPAAEALLSQLILSGNVPAREPLGHRAYLRKGCGRYEEALADYDLLVRDHGDDPAFRALRADTLRLLGRHEDALRDAVAVLGIDPWNTIAAQVVASCQSAQKNMVVPEAPWPSPERIEPMGPMNPAIEAIERSPSSYPTSVFPMVSRFLYTMTKLVRPALVLETGTFIGYSTISMAQALEENGGGHIHTFDVYNDRPGWVSPIIGPCEDALAVARAHVEHAGLSHRVTMHKGDSSDNIRAFLATTDAPVDMAFIDGDHTVAGAIKDFMVIHPRLRNGGIILLHDTIPDRCGWYGPRYLMEELDRAMPNAYQWINIPTPEGCGMGMLRKVADTRSTEWKPPFIELLRDKWFLKRWRRLLQVNNRQL